MSKLRVALCQMAVGADKAANIARAVSFVRSAAGVAGAVAPCPTVGTAGGRAELVVLPECFNCPYGTKYFNAYAESIPATGTNGKDAVDSPTVSALAAAAEEAKVWIVAGSIPERTADGKLYNSSITFAPDGSIRGLHRKIHLFKIDTPTVKMDEAEVLTAGTTPTIVDATEGLGVKLGVAICFDIRYPQLAQFYQEHGTHLLVYPGAFNMVTGPKHWELTARARAVDNQQFVALCSPARDEKADYIAFGHSLLVDAWGEVVVKAEGGEECLVMGDMDVSTIAPTRQRLPILAGTRNDLYALSWNGPSAAQ